MTLTITLKESINGFWDGGAKTTFNWDIQGRPQKDNSGYFIKVESWEGNQWFMIGCGKNKIQTDKQILSNLKTKLLKTLQNKSILIESAVIS